MKRSVVIACYNAQATIGECLESLSPAHQGSLEIVVVDDGSTDDSAEIAERTGADVLRRTHAGRAAALNAGIAAATGEAILFTDSDCVAPPGWADSMARYLDEGWDGVGGNLVPSEWTAVETAKILRYLHEFETDAVLEGAYTRWCLNGNNMAIRRAALERAGGFDEGYVHGADADLTRRLLETGHRLLRTRAVETRHLKIDTWSSMMRTFYLRGSAVRFAMRDRRITPRSWVSAFVSPLRRAAADGARIGAMRRRFPAASWSALLAAPWVHLCADWQSARGQMAFHRAFQ